MNTDVDDVLFRMRNLKEFKIKRTMDEGFILNGKMPYHVKLDKNNVLTVTLMAVDKQEAERRVSEFITGMKND